MARRRASFDTGFLQKSEKAAKHSRVTKINVVVCGLTSSSFQGMSGQGAGKSVLCNRFIRPNQDDLRLEHNTVLNLSEFGSNVINNTHFLYWGEKLAEMDDGQTVQWQIVEHTEFINDLTLQPFPYSKPYHKRVVQLRQSSSGKTTYIDPNQLAVPEEYYGGKFPRRFDVDGFIVCADVSTDFNDPRNPQRDFIELLLKSIVASKYKPVVLAMTKFDRVNESTAAAVKDIVAKSKRVIPMIEVSALEGLNVDRCFLMLAHLVNKKLPNPKMFTLSKSKRHRERYIHKMEEEFQTVLRIIPVQFDTPVEDARKMLEDHEEFTFLTNICGTKHVNKIIRAKLTSLKQELVKEKQQVYIDSLPQIFESILPNLELDATTKTCKEMLLASKDLSTYFVDVNGWKNDEAFLKLRDDKHVPLEVLQEIVAEEFLQKHIDVVLKDAREESSTVKIQEALKLSTVHQTGKDMDQLWEDLGVADDVKYVSSDRLFQIYHDYMGSVEQQCLSELEELLLEHHDIFDKNISSEADMITKVSEELRDFECYKRLENRPDVRHSHILKHIVNLQCQEHSIYGESHLAEKIKSLIANGTLSREKYRPLNDLPPHSWEREEAIKETSGKLQWILDTTDLVFNLSILARTTDYAITLQSDFLNYLGYHRTCLVGDKAYRLEMSLFVGEDIETMTDDNFVPQGAVVVVNTMECLEWLEKVLNKHWIPTSDSSPPYRGMPLVILALDDTAEPDVKADSPQSPLHQGAKRLANSVQCVCMMERPTPQPKRLVVTTVIHQLILSLMNGVTHVDEFYYSADLTPNNQNGLNIAVCTMRDDPYSTEALITPWLNHQLVSAHEGDTTALFVRSAIDKQHRTCTLTFHSSLNLKDIMSFVRLGIILIYSTERHASLAVMKSLLSKLPNLPKLIVAMAAGGTHDKERLEEGRELANSYNAMFVGNNEETLPLNFFSDFFHKCWLNRFNSYVAQGVSGSRLSSRRLPDRPSSMSVKETGFNPSVPPEPIHMKQFSTEPYIENDHPQIPVLVDRPLLHPPSNFNVTKYHPSKYDDGVTLDAVVKKHSNTDNNVEYENLSSQQRGSLDGLKSNALTYENVPPNSHDEEDSYVNLQQSPMISPNVAYSSFWHGACPLTSPNVAYNSLATCNNHDPLSASRPRPVSSFTNRPKTHSSGQQGEAGLKLLGSQGYTHLLSHTANDDHDSATYAELRTYERISGEEPGDSDSDDTYDLIGNNTPLTPTLDITPRADEAAKAPQKVNSSPQDESISGEEPRDSDSDDTYDSIGNNTPLTPTLDITPHADEAQKVNSSPQDDLKSSLPDSGGSSSSLMQVRIGEQNGEDSTNSDNEELRSSDGDGDDH